MKKNMMCLLIALVSVCLVSPLGWAKPERIHIKNLEKKNKEKTAKTQIKNIDLKNIEDPEARRAIREILNYLNLKAKN